MGTTGVIIAQQVISSYAVRSLENITLVNLSLVIVDCEEENCVSTLNTQKLKTFPLESVPVPSQAAMTPFHDMFAGSRAIGLRQQTIGPRLL